MATIAVAMRRHRRRGGPSSVDTGDDLDLDLVQGWHRPARARDPTATARNYCQLDVAGGRHARNGDASADALGECAAPSGLAQQDRDEGRACRPPSDRQPVLVVGRGSRRSGADPRPAARQIAGPSPSAPRRDAGAPPRRTSVNRCSRSRKGGADRLRHGLAGRVGDRTREPVDLGVADVQGHGAPRLHKSHGLYLRVHRGKSNHARIEVEDIPMNLQGQVAIVTGAASGLGRATAEALAAEGAMVAMLDLDAAALGPAAPAVGGHAFALDVADAGGSRGGAARDRGAGAGAGAGQLRRRGTGRPGWSAATGRCRWPASSAWSGST